MAFNFELPKLVNELKKAKPKSVLVQLPEGMKQNVSEIIKTIEDLGIKVTVSGQTCWGACSIAVQEAEALKVDLLVHFGHSKFIDSKFPVIYIEVRDEIDLKPIMKKSLKELKKYKTIGIAYSVQHRHDLPIIKKFYTDNGKKVLMPKKRGYAAYPGHIVGCEYTGLKEIQDNVDAFVIIGNRFHGLGGALATHKPVYLIDVYNDTITNMSQFKDKIVKQRAIAISKMKDADTVGIIVEIKPGQKFGNPKFLVEKFRKAGKEVIVIVMDELTNEKIMNFYNIDAFVELACPRIATDDYSKYEKPILTFREALVAIGEKKWEDLLESGIV